MLWKKGQNFILLSDKNSLSSIYNTHLRFKNRKSWSLRVLTLVWLLIIGVWLYSVSSNFELDQLLRGQDGLFQALELANFNPLFSDYLRKLLPEPHKNFRSSENLIHSEIYDPIIKDYGLSTILNDLSFNERCELYFNELYKNEPNWKLDPYHRYNKDVEQMKSFSEFHLDHVLYDSRELGIDPSELHFSEAKEREIKQKYDKMHKKMRRDEQSLHTHLTHFKIFNKCFLTSNSGLVKSEIDTFVTSQKQSLKEMGIDSSQQELQEIGTLPKQNFSSCDDIERRVYPWLTGKLPKYIRWDGTIHDGSIPQICTYTGENCEELPVEAPIESMLTGNKQCFLNNMRTQLNGKGIALTIDDRHTEITIRLIRLLRYHGNRYPIQIVYILWVSEESRKQLIKASREMLTDQNGNELVQQELWFVDVSQSLHKKYYVKFRSFGNKILATLFNSFAELMLVDSDTVMLQSPDYFFNMPQYNEHGAFFYRDRSAQYRTKSDAMFFRKMMPSLLDTAIFDFPQVTNYTLDRELFNGLTHYMESGLVMVNRKRHFLQALTMAQISFMDPINKRVHGDKELFFLSLTIYGDEGYSFNKNFAASIGVETPIEERLVEVKKKIQEFQRNPERKSPPKGYTKTSFRSKEICSNHPAHIDDGDNHTLLWINSGFKHCGMSSQVNFGKEFKQRVRLTEYDTLEKFKQLFNQKLVIKEAIIPPFDAKLGLDAKNDEFEPEAAWRNIGELCKGYTWCAYSLIGGDFEDFNKKKFSNTFQTGTLVQFTETEIAKFNELGDVWMSDFDFRSDKQIFQDFIAYVNYLIMKIIFVCLLCFGFYKAAATVYSNWESIVEKVRSFTQMIVTFVKQVEWATFKRKSLQNLDYFFEKTINLLGRLRSTVQSKMEEEKY